MKSVFWWNFYRMLKESHNIFKDFEDKMTSPEKKFFQNITLLPSYVKLKKNQK
jgi:hypothetical protein